ncbi:MAG: DUF2799 domain-containing protein [Pseudomonadota bacterium]
MLLSHPVSPTRRLGTLAVLAGLLAGCAHMDEEQCQLADWRTIGFEDGARGLDASRISKHREVCARHGVSPDLAAYQDGREAGLRQFCRPANGFDQGQSGNAYRGACPADLEADFLMGWNAGRQIWEVASAVREAEQQLQRRESRLASVKEDVQEAEAELIRDGVTADRRAELLAQVKALAEEQGALESEITELLIELDRREERLAYERATARW